uniref:Putative ovule protein n=1 Tax=Solanum chacoense TaxID=4108 RepID=A0A0V0GP57_SOLCH
MDERERANLNYGGKMVMQHKHRFLETFFTGKAQSICITQVAVIVSTQDIHPHRQVSQSAIYAFKRNTEITK